MLLQTRLEYQPTKESAAAWRDSRLPSPERIAMITITGLTVKLSSVGGRMISNSVSPSYAASRHFPGVSDSAAWSENGNR
jgi:hypothetical protein